MEAIQQDHRGHQERRDAGRLLPEQPRRPGGRRRLGEQRLRDTRNQPHKRCRDENGDAGHDRPACPRGPAEHQHEDRMDHQSNPGVGSAGGHQIRDGDNAVCRDEEGHLADAGVAPAREGARNHDGVARRDERLGGHGRRQSIAGHEQQNRRQVHEGRRGQDDVRRVAAPGGEARVGRGARRTVLGLHEAPSQRNGLTRTSWNERRHASPSETRHSTLEGARNAEVRSSSPPPSTTASRTGRPGYRRAFRAYTPSRRPCCRAGPTRLRRTVARLPRSLPDPVAH